MIHNNVQHIVILYKATYMKKIYLRRDIYTKQCIIYTKKRIQKKTYKKTYPRRDINGKIYSQKNIHKKKHTYRKTYI